MNEDQLLSNFGVWTKRLKLLDKTFEVAYPAYGNFTQGPIYALAYSPNIVHYDYDVIESFKFPRMLKFKLLKSRTNLSYLGVIPGVEIKLNDPKLLAIFSISLEDKTTDLGKAFNCNKLYEVSLVQVREVNRELDSTEYTNISQSGIASSVYKFFSDSGISLLGDVEQYLGARRLWSKISKDTNYQVDIVDIKNKKVIVSDTEIYHGLSDEEFDKRVWSLVDETIINDIRVLLRSKNGK